MVAMLAHARSTQICQEVRGSILFLYFVFVWRDSSLIARYTRGKPHPRLEVRGSILFSRVHGVKCRTADLNPMRKAFLGFCLGGLPCCLVLLPF